MCRVGVCIIAALVFVVPYVQTTSTGCRYFDPTKGPEDQPATFCRYIDCSRFLTGTSWHYVPGYIDIGRCCKPVFGTNETFNICERNGHSDQLASCNNSLHNFRSPFLSSSYANSVQFTMDVCRERGPLDKSLIPLVKWPNEFIAREGTSISLVAEVQTQSPIMAKVLLRGDLPWSKTTYTIVGSKGLLVVTLDRVTKADEDQYYLVITNEYASGKSGAAKLTVLPDENPTTVEPPVASASGYNRFSVRHTLLMTTVLCICLPLLFAAL